MSNEKTGTTRQLKKLKNKVLTALNASNVYQVLPLAYVWLAQAQSVRIKLVKPIMYDTNTVDLQLNAIKLDNNAKLLITEDYDPHRHKQYEYVLVALDYKIIDFEPLSNTSVILVSKGYFEVNKNVKNKF